MARPQGRLRNLLEKMDRTVAGLISGTSADGIDCAITHIEGRGPGLSVDTLSFVSIPYPEALRKKVLENSEVATSSVKDLSQLNFRIAYEFAAAVRAACAEAGMELDALDLAGSHGQTVHHVPDPEDVAGIGIRSTLQIGDPSVLANLIGVPVVGDFRVADMALDGQGAPLVPYGDYALFSDREHDRILLNLGGIANITVLEAGGAPDAVTAFDTGPANMIVDSLAQRLFEQPFDEGGKIAASGTVNSALLEEMLADPYYSRRPPKSTGRERFGADYVDRLVARAVELQCSDVDQVATATELTAVSVANSIRDFTSLAGRRFQLVVGGGGAHNDQVMRRLREILPRVEVIETDALGVPADAREAVCFAVLAHETLNEQPTAIAAATGASRSAVLGKICLPTPP